MKSIPSALLTHLAGNLTTLATCWRITRQDGQVFGFTDHNEDIKGVGDGVIYSSANSYTTTNVQTGSALAVDNMEVEGVLSSASMTEDDLRAGVWDYASISVFYVNWKSPSDGVISIRDGHLGEVSLERGAFRAELRGMLQSLSRTMGELTSPGCRASLGDGRCTVNLALFSASGAITGVNPDGVTLYDTSLAQPGPTGSVAITGVSNANPCHISYSGSLTLVENQAVVLSGIVGPATLNVVVQVRNPGAGGFDLDIDTTNTTNYPVYVSGGTVTPLGGNSGYFDGGVITFTSGNNNGFSMEIKAYVPGQLTLQLPMPYPVLVGDTYDIVAGCDKSMTTCRDRFNNIVNFRGEPYLPGIDKLQQIGKK